MRILFRGGTVVSGNGTRKADLVTDGEKVRFVGSRYRGTFDRAVSVNGCLLFPGFVDAHTGFDSEQGGATSADNFYTGSKAALRGGTTTVLNDAVPDPDESPRGTLSRWHDKADGQTFCDYGFHMGLYAWNQSVRAEAAALFRDGISSFLLSTGSPGDREFFEALRDLYARGGLCAAECGSRDVAEALGAEGNLSPAAWPVALEAEGVARALRLAQMARVPVIIRSLSSGEALSEVLRARRRGQSVYAETCPHYLTLDESLYFQDDTAAALYVCEPPLRERVHQQALWRALRKGDIQLVSSGHRAFTPVQKRSGHNDFIRIPSGLPGAEERGELLYSRGVAEHRFGLTELCRVLCENPAKLYGLWPRKGGLFPGADADIVVYDPGDSHLILSRDRASAAGYTPYEGFRTAGGIRQVWLRGTLSVDRGRVLPVTPHGLYLRRGKSAL